MSTLKEKARAYSDMLKEQEEKLKNELINSLTSKRGDESLNKIDWEQRRYEISKDLISACMTRDGFYETKEQVCDACIEISDELIKKLRGG